jgi:hypothetical protein
MGESRLGRGAGSHRARPSVFETICYEFYAQSCEITVIKSLDHWPDFGSDLDLHTNAPPKM